MQTLLSTYRTLYIAACRILASPLAQWATGGLDDAVAALQPILRNLWS